MYRKRMLALCASVLLLSACGGGGGSESLPPVTPATGVFIDSAVSGLHYQTPSLSGTTNSAGEFEYLPGETVTFSIGGIVLGSSLAGPVITPLALVSGAMDANNPVVINIVRLLLTLDDDGEPDNGISIPSATATAAAGLTVDFTVADLATETDLTTLLAALPGVSVLTDPTVAQMHFAATLAAQSEWGAMAWGAGSWKSKNM